MYGCNRGFYCRSYCLLNMFRAQLCPSSGAQEYYTVVAACGISCCGFSSSWSGVEPRVMCPVCRMLQHPANRTHNPQLHTRPATWKLNWTTKTLALIPVVVFRVPSICISSSNEVLSYRIGWSSCAVKLAKYAPHAVRWLLGRVARDTAVGVQNAEMQDVHTFLWPLSP